MSISQDLAAFCHLLSLCTEPLGLTKSHNYEKIHYGVHTPDSKLSVSKNSQNSGQLKNKLQKTLMNFGGSRASMLDGHLDLHHRSASNDHLASSGGGNLPKTWHLVSPSDYDDTLYSGYGKIPHPSKNNSNGRTSSTRRLLDQTAGTNELTDEFHNLRLFTSRRSLDEYMKPALEATVPTDIKNVPPQLKYLLDLLDILIQENRYKDCDKTINHVWKSNSILKKYWAQGIINKPENIFDIPSDLISNETLKLVAKTLNDACEWGAVEKPSHFEDAVTLIIYQQTEMLQDVIRKHYRTVSEKTPVSKDEMIECMNSYISNPNSNEQDPMISSIHSAFDRTSVLTRLWRQYIMPNYDRITSNNSLLLSNDGGYLVEDLKMLFDEATTYLEQ